MVVGALIKESVSSQTSVPTEEEGGWQGVRVEGGEADKKPPKHSASSLTISHVMQCPSPGRKTGLRKT